MSRRDAKKELWRRVLEDLSADSYAHCSRGRSLRGLVVTGKLRSRPQSGFVILILDPQTGETLKRADVPTRRSIHPSRLLVQGKLLAIEDDGILYGFDPETLERTWTVGRGP